MPAVTVHPPSKLQNFSGTQASNPLPQLLKTPTGLAILELQGTINLPEIDVDVPDGDGESNGASPQTSIGRLVFPDYSAQNPLENTAWMKRVYLYVGKHQRLTGEVKKLPNPIAVIGRKNATQRLLGDVTADGGEEELEIVEIVKWKILFSQRPEPVGS